MTFQTSVIFQMPASSPATAFPRSSLVRSSAVEPPRCQDLSMPPASQDCILFPQWAVGETVPNPCLGTWFLRPLLVPLVFVLVLGEADTKMGLNMWECIKRNKSLMENSNQELEKARRAIGPSVKERSLETSWTSMQSKGGSAKPSRSFLAKLSHQRSPMPPGHRFP